MVQDPQYVLEDASGNAYAYIWHDGSDLILEDASSGNTVKLGSGGFTDPSGESHTDLEDETHATDHENGGADEINVGGLSGDLADAQDPTAHASTHSQGSSDPVTVENLTTSGGARTVPVSDGSSGLSMTTLPGEGVRVEKTSDQSVSASTDVAVTFDNKVYDDNSEFDLANDTFSPSATGRYRVMATLQYSGVADGDTVQAKVDVGGTDEVVATNVAASTSPLSVTVSATLDLASSDTVTIDAFTGASNTVFGQDDRTYAEFIRVK